MKKNCEKKKVSKVMGEYKFGLLKSGSGTKVSNPKQAIAIALSESKRGTSSGGAFVVGGRNPPCCSKCARKKK